MSADEEAIYNFITELFKTRQVGDKTFATAKNVVGERGVVDLLITAGYYQIVSMYMSIDRMPVAENQKPELKYIARPIF
jgi:4-carboxymuconolactone decarboxylase